MTSKSLDSAAYCYVLYLALPATIISTIATTRVHPSTWASPIFQPSISVCHTRLFAHIGVSRLRPRMLTSQPALPLSSGSYCVKFSLPFLLLLASCDSARLSQSCFSDASWHHQAPPLRPPPSYPYVGTHQVRSFCLPYAFRPRRLLCPVSYLPCSLPRDLTK